MKKLICVLVMVVALGSMMTGCFTCQACKESKLITSENEILGVKICDDCMNMAALGEME